MKQYYDLFKEARDASMAFCDISAEKINEVLLDLSDTLVKAGDRILEANRKDLSLMDESNPKYDRLKLSESRLEGIAGDMRNVVSLPSPLDIVLDRRTLPNGLELTKVSVPIGVIGIVYESRPNVTFDVFSLCFKSGSACVLKGGHEAENSNNAIVEMIKEVLKKHNINSNVITLLPNDREATNELMHAVGLVDVNIPRGGRGLIDFVRNNSVVPVIETGAGVCHTYFDVSADINKGKAIVTNAKTRRVSVCNALDCLLIARERLSELPLLLDGMISHNVVVYADSEAYSALNGNYPAELLEKAVEDDFGREFLDYKMAVKTVDGVDEAISHIDRYGSKHSECIVTEDANAAKKFCRKVDAACVYENAPTSFTDGAQFGLGAEIGISTQKLHARGPMALREITTYKWLIKGSGQIRP